MHLQIVNYSEKAIAVFGETKPVKDELKKMGGKFNPYLTHNGQKEPGWIFSKRTKEIEVRNFVGRVVNETKNEVDPAASYINDQLEAGYFKQY